MPRLVARPAVAVGSWCGRAPRHCVTSALDTRCMKTPDVAYQELSVCTGVYSLGRNIAVYVLSPVAALVVRRTSRGIHNGQVRIFRPGILRSPPEGIPSVELTLKSL